MIPFSFSASFVPWICAVDTSATPFRVTRPFLADTILKRIPKPSHDYFHLEFTMVGLICIVHCYLNKNNPI